MRRTLGPCVEPGCPNLTLQTRCLTHTRSYTAAHRGNFRHIYKTKRWQIARQQALRAHPYCEADWCTQPATDVDHITPLAEFGEAYNPRNLQSLCHAHHSQKTAREVWVK